MGGTDLRGRLLDSFRWYYSGTISEQVGSGGHDGRGIESTFSRLADRMLEDEGVDPRVLLSIMRGDADPEIVTDSLSRVLNGKSPFYRTPYPPGTRLFSTPIGDIIAGPMHSLFTPRGGLSSAALRARAALLTTGTTARGRPRLGEFAKVFVGGERVPVSSESALGGGFMLYSSPFLSEIRGADETVVMRDDMRSRFNRAVADIRYQDDLWETYGQFIYDLLKRIEFARRTIVTMVGNTAQARQLLQRSSHRLLLGSTLKSVQAVLAPIEQQTEVANRAFIEVTPLGDTLVGQAIRAQVCRLAHELLPLMFVRMAPSPESLELMDGEHPLAVGYTGIRELVSDAGLGILFDLQRYVQDTYVDSPFARAGNLNIWVQAGGPKFNFFDPIPARLLIDALMYRTVYANRRKLPADLGFAFDAVRQSIDVTFSTAQPGHLKGVLRDAADLWGFQGVVDCKNGGDGIRAVTIARVLETPSDGCDTLRWNEGDLGSADPEIYSGGEEAIDEGAVAAGDDAVSSLVIPSSILAATLPLGTIK